MNKEIIKDHSNKTSSKRVWGSLLLSVGIVFSLILFFIAIQREVPDAPTALSIINMFLLAGSSLLGIGVFEKIINKKDV